MTYIPTLMENYPDLVSLMKATEHNTSFKVINNHYLLKHEA